VLVLRLIQNSARRLPYAIFLFWHLTGKSAR